MAYSGTTAASSVANPPAKIASMMGGGVNSTAFGVAAGAGAKSIWLYNSSHSTTEMLASGFFSDGYYLGMKQGDIVIGGSCTGSSVGVFMASVGAVTTAGCALASSGGILSSTR